MNKDVLDFARDEYAIFDFSEDLLEVISEFICDIMKHENVSLEDIKFAGEGKTSKNIQIGEYVLKVGLTRRTKQFKNSARILQPIIRREIKMDDGEKAFVEVQNAVDTDWYKENRYGITDIVYQVYRDLRDEGLVWTDLKFKNIGRLLKDNRINYTERVHNSNEESVIKELEPDEVATGLKGKPKKILKAGDYVLLDTDFVFDEKDLSDENIKEILLDSWYNTYEMRYQREKKNRNKNKENSR